MQRAVGVNVGAFTRVLSFGALLRHYRRAAGLTQEELAARAGVSAHTISDLERDVAQRPRKDTVTLLAEALQLTEAARRLRACGASIRCPGCGHQYRRSA